MKKNAEDLDVMRRTSAVLELDLDLMRWRMPTVRPQV